MRHPANHPAACGRHPSKEGNFCHYDYTSDFYAGGAGGFSRGCLLGACPLHPLERVFGYFLHEQKVTPVRQDKVDGPRPQKYSAQPPKSPNLTYDNGFGQNDKVLH